MPTFEFLVTPINEQKSCKIDDNDYEAAYKKAVEKAEFYYPGGFHVELAEVTYGGKIGLCKKILDELLPILSGDTNFAIVIGGRTCVWIVVSNFVDNYRAQHTEEEWVECARECLKYFMEEFYDPSSFITYPFTYQEDHLLPEFAKFLEHAGICQEDLVKNRICTETDIEKWKMNEAHNRNVIKISDAMDSYVEDHDLIYGDDIPDDAYDRIVQDLDLEPEGWRSKTQ